MPNKFTNIEIDQFVIMPNHIHGIIAIVQWFKTMTTNEYIQNVKTLKWFPFPGKLWQRNYYEHIIHNENELNAIREYIVNNPLKWELDQNNPRNVQY